MSKAKKLIRENFNASCLKRDNNRCRMCGAINTGNHDVHHIIDRSEMPNQGYVKENGITLCEPCHEKAELFHSKGLVVEGGTPADLFKVIGSSKELATQKSENYDHFRF